MWPSRWSHNLWVSGSDSWTLEQKNHVWDVSCQRSPSVTVSFIDFKRNHYLWQSKKTIRIKSAETWIILFPVPLITLSPAWRRRRRCPEFPSSFLVDSSFLMVCFWELDILWWDYFSKNFRISVQVIFQCDYSAIIRTSDHRNITSWTVELKTSIWGVSQTVGLRQLVRVMFLCQFFRYCLLSFVPSKFFLWFAISRTSQKSVQNSCVIFVLSIRCKSGDGRFVLQIFHVELREKITS